MYDRICIIVLDGIGIGAMPDAAIYGDEGTHTLGNIYAKRGKLDLPNLYAMGLAHIQDAKLGDTPLASPAASYGRMATKTRAKDTTSGHWELAGLIMEPPFATFTRFPDKLLREWLTRANNEGLVSTTSWLGNYPASGTQIIDLLGETHMQTHAPIVYTSADSVFQVAAHEDIIPVEAQYRMCQLARELLTGDNIVGRVIARPFTGQPGAFTRTKNRRDYAVPPTGTTLLDALAAKGQHTLGIGKIQDIFCGCGITHSIHTKNNTDGINATINALEYDHEHKLIFTNLVDFDMLYGHRNDPEGFAQALEYFDSRLPEILAALNSNDLLILTSDHGCDPTTPSTDHSREYVPVLVHAQGMQSINLGTRCTLADVTATIYDVLGHGAWPVGKPFEIELH